MVIFQMLRLKIGYRGRVRKFEKTYAVTSQFWNEDRIKYNDILRCVVGGGGGHVVCDLKV